MYLLINLEQYDENCIYFCDPIINNVIEDSSFIKIIYSTDKFVLSGIYLLISFVDVFCEKYYNKYKCIFNVTNNKNIVEKIKVIEENILSNFVIKGKTPEHKIFEQIKNGHVKLFNSFDNKHSCNFMLKIAGIWETKDKYGLTYKFTKIE